jgi:peptidoglycan/LPS O-acetylase OafA/YrhL
MPLSIRLLTPTLSRHGNNFNLMRLLLAIGVIVAHAAELLDGSRVREPLTGLFGTISLGELGVNGFFLLSGYLIVKSWFASPQPWDFLKKRALRIFPGFIVASIICVWLIGPTVGNVNYWRDLDLGGFLAGLLLLQMPQTPPVFSGLHFELINAAMWTIRFEFLMYLAVLVFGVGNMLKRKHVWLGTTIVLLFINMLHGFGVVVPLRATPDLLSLQIVHLSLVFFAGGCFYLYREAIGRHAGLALLALLVTLSSLFYPALVHLAFATTGAYVLLFFCNAHTAQLQWFNRMPDVSYGTYLAGWPVSQLLIWHWRGIALLPLMVLSVLLSMAYGAFSWYAVEKPFLRLKQRQSMPAIGPVGTV